MMKLWATVWEVELYGLLGALPKAPCSGIVWYVHIYICVYIGICMYMDRLLMGLP